MTENDVPHPPIVTRDAWNAEREKLRFHEKELTRHYDRVAAERRRLPMVKIDKDYVFDDPDGKSCLRDLFGDKRQLIIYHFMFDPAWDEGCPGCTGYVDALGDLSPLGKCDTTFALVSRAPQEKLTAYRAKHGWDISWYSSLGSDFNRDFHVTNERGEAQGVSVFFRLGDEIYHTYSTHNRGTEFLTDTYPLLDVTPYGRQESFEDSPAGWPQKPTYG